MLRAYTIIRNCLRVAIVCMLLMPAGCRRYADATRTASAFATALYASCNLQSTARLEMIESQIASAEIASQLTKKESNYLRTIITRAKEGDWQTAAADSRELLLDQVK